MKNNFEAAKRFLKPDLHRSINFFLYCLKFYRIFGFSPYIFDIERQVDMSDGESYIVFKYEKTSKMINYSKIARYLQLGLCISSAAFEMFLVFKMAEITTPTEKIIDTIYIVITNISGFVTVIYLGSKITQFGNLLQLLEEGFQDRFFIKSQTETNSMPWHVAYLALAIIVISENVLYVYTFYSHSSSLFQESEYHHLLIALAILHIVAKNVKVTFFIAFLGIMCSSGSIFSLCFIALKRYFLKEEKNMIEIMEPHRLSSPRSNSSSRKISFPEIMVSNEAVNGSNQLSIISEFQPEAIVSETHRQDEPTSPNAQEHGPVNFCLDDIHTRNDLIPGKTILGMSIYQMHFNKYIAFPLVIATVYSVFAIIVFLFFSIVMKGGSLITSGLIAWIIPFCVPVISVYWQADDVRLQVLLNYSKS